MKFEPCAYCDFIGPVVLVEQPVIDFHRQFHESIRSLNRAFGPLIEAMREVGDAATKTRLKIDDFRLAGPSEGDSK